MPLALKDTVSKIRQLSFESGILNFTHEQISDSQWQDPHLEPILNWLRKDHEPVDSELWIASTETKFYRLLKYQLVIRDNILYYQFHQIIAHK